jgi:release factor glutamine methyltransferase
VYAEEEAALLLGEAASPEELDRMVQDRVDGWPLEQVLGWAELSGVRVRVGRDVFVPRRRSELLVREALTVARGSTRRPVVVDLCCGCGAVGVAVAVLHGDVELHAVELDAASAACARGNVVPTGGVVHEGDLFDPLPASLRGRVDVLVVNAPYVPSDELTFLPSEAREHEPLMALDGGDDGVAIQRRVAAGARGWLAPGGHLLVETSERQVPLTVAAFESAGLVARVAVDDDLGATVVVGSSGAV